MAKEWEVEGMSKNQSLQIPMQHRKDCRHLYQIEIGFHWFLIIPALIIAAHKMSIWPDIFLGFLVVGIPVILLGFRPWNRWSHPDQLPTRWIKHGEEDLQNLGTVLNLTGIVAFLVMVVIGILAYDNEYRALRLLSWTCCTVLAWSDVLDRYIEDRKYIPPPSPPHDPSKTGLADIKPFRSEHWGNAGGPGAGGSEQKH
jgi:hypothetical protein